MAGELERATNTLEQSLANEQVSPELREALNGLIDAIRSTSGAPAVSASVDSGSFWDRVKGSADLRLRHEHDGIRGKANRDRERVRLRFGIKADLGEEFEAGFRLRTGSPMDPRSPYHNFGSTSTTGDNSLQSLEFNIDRAWLKYRPSSIPGAWVTAGKFDHPFAKNPVYGELVWDDDVNPEGVVGGFGFEASEGLNVNLVAGQYLLFADDSTSTTDGSDAELSAFVAQAAANYKGDGFKALAALGWYRYGDTSPDMNNAALPVSNDISNSTTAADFVADFHILNPIAALTFDCGGQPLTISGEYILNTGADGGANGDDGYAVGTSFGSTGSPGGWKVFYQWQRVQQDAVFSPYSQDDFLLNGSNFRGHVYGVKYKLSKRIGLRAWGLTSVAENSGANHGPNVPDEDYSTRLRFEVDAKF